MLANPFSAQSLAICMAGALPFDSSPQFNSIYDVIALAVHASMLAVDFRLIGLGDEDRIETLGGADQPQVLPSAWNASDGSYSFRYAHSRSSMEFIIKVSKMGGKAVVMGIALGDDRTCSFDVTAKEYVLEGKHPSSPISKDDSVNEAARSMSSQFLSDGRLSDFGSLMLVRIIQKLAPSISKGEPMQDQGETSQQRFGPDVRDERPQYDPLRETHDPPVQPTPFVDPLAEPPRPRRPLPDSIPGFEDEHEILRGPGGGMPRAGFPRIGERDLYPAGLGPNDPFYGGVGPGLGPMGGGGMHPTFDDPLFTGQGRRPPQNPQAPLGSRFDPVGPEFNGHPRGAGMGGRPPNPFGGFGDGDFI